MGERYPAERGQYAVAVVIYLPFQILKGAIHRPGPIRLTDRINSIEDDFLTLHEPRVIDLAKQQLEPVPVPGPWFVYLQQVLIIHETPSAGPPTAAAGRPEERVPKLPAPVQAYVGPFRVQGDMYVSEYSDADAYLNRTSMAFIPLTSVLITLPSRSDLGVISMPFVLVNRSRLVIGPAGGEASA